MSSFLTVFTAEMSTLRLQCSKDGKDCGEDCGENCSKITVVKSVPTIVIQSVTTRRRRTPLASSSSSRSRSESLSFKGVWRSGLFKAKMNEVDLEERVP